MSFFDMFSRRHADNIALVSAMQENTTRLEAVVQALNDRESPEVIREAVSLGLKDGGLENALATTSVQLGSLNTSLLQSGSRPIPVQPVPPVP